MRAKLLDIEIDIDTLECDLNIVNANLAYISAQKSDLEDNLSILKQSGIITSIKGYQETKRQLKEIEKRRVFFNNRKIELKRVLKGKEKSIGHYADRLDNLLDIRNGLRSEVSSVVNINDFRRKKEK